MRVAEPGDELRQARGERSLRIVTQEVPRFRNVRTGNRHITGLFGQLVDFRFAAERVLDGCDQVPSYLTAATIP